MNASFLLLASLLIAFAAVAFSVPVDQTSDDGGILPAGNGELLDGGKTVDKRGKKKTKVVSATTDGPVNANKKHKKNKHTTVAPSAEQPARTSKQGKKGKKAGKSKDKTKNRRGQKSRPERH